MKLHQKRGSLSNHPSCDCRVTATSQTILPGRKAKRSWSLLQQQFQVNKKVVATSIIRKYHLHTLLRYYQYCRSIGVIFPRICNLKPLSYWPYRNLWDHRTLKHTHVCHVSKEFGSLPSLALLHDGLRSIDLPWISTVSCPDGTWVDAADAPRMVNG